MGLDVTSLDYVRALSQPKAGCDFTLIIRRKSNSYPGFPSLCSDKGCPSAPGTRNLHIVRFSYTLSDRG